MMKSTETSVKKKKLLDLPEDIVTILTMQAAKLGMSAKAYMESVLISEGKKIGDSVMIEYFMNSKK